MKTHNSKETRLESPCSARLSCSWISQAALYVACWWTTCASQAKAHGLTTGGVDYSIPNCALWLIAGAVWLAVFLVPRRSEP